MYEIKRSNEEIDDVLNKTSESVDQGTTRWAGMSYEQGVEAAILWVTGQTDDNPMED